MYTVVIQPGSPTYVNAIGMSATAHKRHPRTLPDAKGAKTLRLDLAEWGGEAQETLFRVKLFCARKWLLLVLETLMRVVRLLRIHIYAYHVVGPAASSWQVRMREDQMHDLSAGEIWVHSPCWFIVPWALSQISGHWFKCDCKAVCTVATTLIPKPHATQNARSDWLFLEFTDIWLTILDIQLYIWRACGLKARWKCCCIMHMWVCTFASGIYLHIHNFYAILGPWRAIGRWPTEGYLLFTCAVSTLTINGTPEGYVCEATHTTALLLKKALLLNHMCTSAFGCQFSDR